MLNVKKKRKPFLKKKNYTNKVFLLSTEKGKEIKFNILLPPNLEATAPLDLIVIKIEALLFNEQREYQTILLENINLNEKYYFSSSHLKVAKFLEKFFKKKVLNSILQVSRLQLKFILDCLINEPVIFKPDKQISPLHWNDNGTIDGVYNYLNIDSDNKNINDHSIFMDGSYNYILIKIKINNKENPEYKKIESLILKNNFSLDPIKNIWILRDKHKVLNFLSFYWDTINKQFNIIFSNKFKKCFKNTKTIKIYAKSSEINQGFSVYININTYGIDELTFRNNVNKEQYYFITQNNTIVFFPPHKIKALAEVQKIISGQIDRIFSPSFFQKITKEQVFDADYLIRNIADKIEFPIIWKKQVESVKNLNNLMSIPISIDISLKNKLRPYQKIGVSWLLSLYNNNLGGVLSDEMGLGKTVQAIAYLQSIINKTKQNNSTINCLVVCPASLIENWRREIEVFSPQITYFTHHGVNRVNNIAELNKYNVIITSYSTLTRDVNFFSQIQWAVIVADEAQNIKNENTQNAQSLKSLKSKGRFLLTGTPIENSLNDLRSLFDFLMPNYLLNYTSKHTREEKAWYDQHAKRQASYYILRRSKNLVAPELPKKIEQTIFCSMENKQLEIYNNLKNKNKQEILKMEQSGEKENKIRFTAFQQLLRLRQVCVDPRIIDKTCLSEHSAKLKVFKEIFKEALNGNHRILLFSQFVSVLKLVKEELNKMNVKYCYIDGKSKNRLSICNYFNKNESIPIFLISLKAGGYGLNITGANTVIHFDPWWNPAVEAQATDRAHRIGQKKVVTSIKLIISNSIEEKILNLQKKRSKLLQEVFKNSIDFNNNMTLNMTEIKELIK